MRRKLFPFLLAVARGCTRFTKVSHGLAASAD
jgi:hypothetical protein